MCLCDKVLSLFEAKPQDLSVQRHPQEIAFDVQSDLGLGRYEDAHKLVLEVAGYKARHPGATSLGKFTPRIHIPGYTEAHRSVLNKYYHEIPTPAIADY